MVCVTLSHPWQCSRSVCTTTNTNTRQRAIHQHLDGFNMHCGARQQWFFSSILILGTILVSEVHSPSTHPYMTQCLSVNDVSFKIAGTSVSLIAVCLNEVSITWNKQEKSNSKGLHYGIARKAACCLWYQHPIQALVHVLATLFQAQLPANLPGKTAEHSSIAWVLVPTWETQKKPWFLALDWTSSDHCGHWGMNQRMETISLSLSLFPLQINK